MNGMRKCSRYLFVITIGTLLFQSFTFSTVFAADTDQKIDAMLAVDVSTSMNESDKNKIANEAMKMFIDMLSLQGDKVGVVAYTDKVEREKAMRRMNNAEDKRDVKDFIDQVARGPYTDIAVGVSEAVKILESGREVGHIPLIILLADGNNSLNKQRTQERSDQQLQDALKIAKDEGIPIYSIGLNADGKLNKSILENISSETGGKLFVTDTVESLPQILSDIFASHLKLKVVPLADFVANGDYQDVMVSIPNANVLEANITIVSNQTVDVKLFDPSDTERQLQTEGIVYSRSKAYSLIKLINPIQGNWKLQVKGTDKDNIDINLVMNNDFILTMNPVEVKTYATGDTVDIKAWLESNGQKLIEPDLFKNMKSTLMVNDVVSNQTDEFALENKDFEFSGVFRIVEAHDYEIKVRVEDTSFFRETRAAIIHATAAVAPVAPIAPEPITLPIVEKEEPQKPFHWLYIIIASFGLLVVIVLGLYLLSLVKKANKGFYGQMIIETINEDTGERSNPQYKKLNVYKGKIRLYQLMHLAPEFVETNKVILIPGNNDTIVIVNQSLCVIEKGGRVIDAAKGIELRKNDRIRILMHYVNKSIQVEYIN